MELEISDALKNEIKNDVKGSHEKLIEDATLQSLQEIKDKFKFEDAYLSTLYEAKFKNFLNVKTFDEHSDILPALTNLNNIKLRILKQALEQNKQEAQKPNRVARNIIYPTCNISQDLGKNGKMGNIMKGVIDELMAIPDLVVMILKNPIEFAKGLWEMVSSASGRSALLQAIKEAFTDAFTQGTATPEAQYRTGKSSTLIVLSLFPGGIGRSLLNVAKKAGVKTVNATKRIVGKGVKQNVKNTAKSSLKSTEKLGKNTSKKVDTKATQQATKATQKVVDNAMGKKTANLFNRGNIANKAVEKTGNAVRKGAEITGKFVNKLPVLKQINQFKNWTLNKLDFATTQMFKITNPRLYNTFVKQQRNMVRMQNNVSKKIPILEQAANKVAGIQARITKLEAQIAKAPNKGLQKIWENQLIKTQNLVPQLLKDFAKAEKALYKANHTLATYNTIAKMARAGKLANRIRIQQLSDILGRTEVNMIENEIEEVMLGITDDINHAEGIIGELEETFGQDVTKAGLASGFADVGDIALDLPAEGIDWLKYTINIVGLSSKTGARSVNIALAKKRAENAKQSLIQTYNAHDACFNLTEKRQGDYPEHFTDSTLDWQGVQVQIIPNENVISPNNFASQNVDEDASDAEEYLDEQISLI